jgi:hypothetical protein
VVDIPSILLVSGSANGAHVHICTMREGPKLQYQYSPAKLCYTDISKKKNEDGYPPTENALLEETLKRSCL